jgi:hypothetical protein
LVRVSTIDVSDTDFAIIIGINFSFPLATSSLEPCQLL